MLGKLLKHDLKAGARRMGNIYLAALIAGFAMIFSSFTQNGIVKFLSISAVIVIAGIAVIMTFAGVIFGANKSLFGREGYLTQTLPVRTSTLIFSKWLSSCIWLVVSYSVAVVSIVFVAYYSMNSSQDGTQMMFDIISSLLDILGGSGKAFKIWLVVYALIGLFNMCVLVMLIIFTITFSNVRPFHKLGTFGIIIYLAIIIFVIQGATNALADLCDVTLIIQETGLSMTVSENVILNATLTGGRALGLTGVYFKSVVAVFLYILTVQLTESKINLK